MMLHEARRFAFVLLVCLVPTVAFADASVTLARLEGDPSGRATATVRRALGREGVRVVDDAPHRIEGRLSRGALTLRLTGPTGERSFAVRGDTLNELARLGAEALAPALVAPEAASSVTEGPEATPPPEPGREREEALASVAEPTPRAAVRVATSARSLRNAQTAFAFDLALTFENRDLVFRDDLFDRLADYHARFAPALRLAFEWFPAAHAGARSKLAWLGVGGAYDRVFGYESRAADGSATFRTRASSFDVDVRYRIPLDLHAITAMVGYGREAFYVDASGPAAPGSGQAPAVPPTNYGFVRVGADAYLRVAGGLYFGTSAGLRILHARGGLDDWFPNNHGAGVDLGARFSYHIGAALRLGVAADYHRYVFGLNPRPGDFYVAGGAHDNFLRVSLVLGVRVPELR
jgi:hypothetical protein